MRELVGAGRVSTVLAQDRDRVAHESASLFYLREEFGQHGRELIALNDRGDDNPEGQLTDGILDQIARFERLKIAEGSRQRKLRKARGKAPVWDLIFSLLKDPDRSTLIACDSRSKSYFPFCETEVMWVAMPVDKQKPSLLLVSGNT
ncbi:MAG TPA: recombinase family protein [Rubrobacter sp.]|nr:recombinase family protein [Rubrobacter sp.]